MPGGSVISWGKRNCEKHKSGKTVIGDSVRRGMVQEGTGYPRNADASGRREEAAKSSPATTALAFQHLQVSDAGMVLEPAGGCPRA